MLFGGFNLDLLDQLSFYGCYHRHPMNKLIHLVCVPGIAWSALVWFAAAGPLVQDVHFGGLLAKLGVPSVLARCANEVFFFIFFFLQDYKYGFFTFPPAPPHHVPATPLPPHQHSLGPFSGSRAPSPKPRRGLADVFSVTHKSANSPSSSPLPPPLPNS